MKRWGVGWIAGSEHKAHGKIARLFAQPYISQLDYDKVELSSWKEILPAQQSSVKDYERCQQSKATARQKVPPQKVGACGIRMTNNKLWNPDRAVEIQLCLCVEAHCLSAGHRAHEAMLGSIKEYMAWTAMAKDVKVYIQNCLHGVASIPGDKVQRPLGTQLRNQAQRDPELQLPLHCVIKKGEVSVLTTSQG
jgi:hypothetical protein